MLYLAYAAVAVAVIVALLAWSATTDDCDVVVDTMLTPEEPCYDEFFGGDR